MHRVTLSTTASRLLRFLENDRFGVLMVTRKPTSTTAASAAAVATRCPGTFPQWIIFRLC